MDYGIIYVCYDILGAVNFKTISLVLLDAEIAKYRMNSENSLGICMKYSNCKSANGLRPVS